ncbi:hypothetical protein NDU88_004806 [Pleurodeles waltl]|uniref:Uncharacterized protein n=1 Tax=Pleurodeles waltl TaxID=8319 RepID=A0AAV7MUH2_PLEWA|nr:hypothetical protein NDU88_004806 [Pleurodeles waltl]
MPNSALGFRQDTGARPPLAAPHDATSRLWGVRHREVSAGLRVMGWKDDSKLALRFPMVVHCIEGTELFCMM